MQQSTLALIILGITIVVYAIPAVPLSVTTMFSLCAFALTGIISFSEAFSGFGNTATLLVAGMMVIGGAFFSTGLADRLGARLEKYSTRSERTFMLLIMLFAGAMSVLFNAEMVVLLFIPIIDSAVEASGGRLKRKNLYFPLSIAATYANSILTLGASSTMVAIGFYTAAGYDTPSIFAMTGVCLPAVLAVAGAYWLFGMKLQNRVFDFEERPLAAVSGKKPDAASQSRSKQRITLIIIAASVAGMLFNINYAACAMLAVAALILTHCVSEREAFRSVNLSTLVLVAGSLGISAGVQSSGAGEVLSNVLVSHLGALASSPYAMSVVLLVVTAVISNFMSDGGAAAIVSPLALAMAQSNGWNALPLIIAVAAGAKSAIATPLSVVTMTMLQGAGYRFRDYIRVAGPFNVLYALVSCVMLKIVFF